MHHRKHGVPASAPGAAMARPRAACLATCHGFYCLACQPAWVIGISARLDRRTHGSGYSCARTGAVLRSTRLRDIALTARGGDQADRGGPLQGSDVAHFFAGLILIGY